MKLAPWLAVILLVVYGAVVTEGYFSASREAAAAKREVAAVDVFREQQERRLIPVPALKTVDEYGSPYNVTITCTVAGSAEGQNGSRVPLNVDAPPHPGDLYVKTCHAD